MTNPDVKRSIGLPVAIAIVVANMVGTGVFTSLGFQVAGIPSGFPIILLWVLGSVISFCGAVCYAELGAMMPRSGGEYHFLREAFHPVAGFLAGWVSITVGFAVPVAAAAVALGGYAGEISGASPYWFSIPAVVLVTVIHLGRVDFTGAFQVFFTTTKIVLILILAVSAFAIAAPQDVSFLPQKGDGNLIASSSFATSLVYVTYAYAGWNAVAYIAGEVKKPARNLPIAMLVGTAFVTILYIGLNAAFMYSTPIEDMQGNKEVGLIAAKAIFGTRGGNLMGLLISFGLISTISSMTWAGPRVYAMMGEDYRWFAVLGRRNRFGVPAWAILVQGTFVIVFTSFATFEQLINYVQSLLILFGMLTVIAVVWLRIKCPDAERPYRVRLLFIPVTVFTLMSVYILYFLGSNQKWLLILVPVTLGIGIGIYLVAEITSGTNQKESSN